MKNLIASLIVAFSLIWAGALMSNHKVEAQTATPTIGLTFASSLSTCQSIGQNTLCMFGSSTAPNAAVSIGGGAFVALGGAPPTTSGVTSFNTRTGAVASANGDYNFNMLSGVLAGSQLPAQYKCNLLLTLSTPTTATTTNQLSGTAQIGGCQ